MVVPKKFTFRFTEKDDTMSFSIKGQIRKFKHAPYPMFDEKKRELCLMVDHRYDCVQPPVIFENEYAKFKALVPSSEVFVCNEARMNCQFFTLCFVIEDLRRAFALMTFEIMVQYSDGFTDEEIAYNVRWISLGK